MAGWHMVFGLAAFLTTGLCQANTSELKNLQEKAEAGDVEAQFRLATAYDWGRGTSRSGSKAKKWYKKAAAQGHAESQNSLGSICQAEDKYEEALIWYQKAANQDHALAINNLAYLYDLGLGVRQDRKKGHDLYMRSANLGWAEAMFNLANMYGAGHLGEIDYYKAYIWCARSARYVESGWRGLDQKSAECLRYLDGKLTPEQIAKAKQEAADWKPVNKRD